MSFNELIEDTKKAEIIVDELFHRIEDYNDGKVAQKDFSNSQSVELKEALTENSKLKYRLGILKRAIESQEEKNKKCRNANGDTPFISPSTSLTLICMDALRKAFPDIKGNLQPVIPSTNPRFGDYQFNAALQMGEMLKRLGQKMPPLEIAKKIVEQIAPSNITSKIEIAPPGYINIWLNKSFCSDQLLPYLLEGVKPPPLDKKMKVLIDFSSPNIAKQMHVGHLRSTIIGDCVARLLEFLGHDVLRINHVGDWGTQFGMLIAHLQEKFPNFKTETPSIEDLQMFYKESKKRFDEDEQFKRRAYECVVKLQTFEEDYIKSWQLICEASRKEFQIIYDRLDIKLIERGESFYQTRMEKVVKELEEKGLLTFDEGRYVMFGLEEGMIPMTIVKSDGGFTYDTSDMAAIKQRIEEEKGDWLIYVTDLGQSTHFKVLFSCAQKAGIWDPCKVRIDHVGFGVVLGEDKKKFKTRSGETVKLIDLLDEGLKRSEEKLKEKNRHEVLTKEELKAAQEAIAYGCIKYADLCCSRTNDYVFSFDKMLEDKGNTAVYMLYAYTRISAIARNANVTREELKQFVQNGGKIGVNHPKEWNLVKVLLRFNDVLTKISREWSLHNLCEYLYDIATAFTEFYDQCYCIEKDKSGEIKKIHKDRLLLTEITALIMDKCFNIIGLKKVGKM
ncbi:arginine--tRNA ligase, cytoplasmic [Cimex lectularius]|uniref:Probable arginine--tRNA ligase, cytoplasmic n=1 Tax=Cimex lectularius TaxID=79782 RepID=A0A8I6S9C3_CIMLE|nr:arginine--tRNA ligase, cytoplasmic [Cimex lectularius]